MWFKIYLDGRDWTRLNYPETHTPEDVRLDVIKKHPDKVGTDEVLVRREKSPMNDVPHVAPPIVFEADWHYPYSLQMRRYDGKIAHPEVIANDRSPNDSAARFATVAYNYHDKLIAALERILVDRRKEAVAEAQKLLADIKSEGRWP